MKRFGNLTTACSPCITGKVHVVTAEGFRYGWPAKILSTPLPSDSRALPGASWTVLDDLPYDGNRVYSTLAISGLTVYPAYNATRTVDQDSGPADEAEMQGNSFAATAWLTELVDADWAFKVTTSTRTQLSIELHEKVGSVYEYNHTVTMTLSGEVTDADVRTDLDTMLDNIDWDDTVFLFDPAHQARYTVFKCPALIAGKPWYDSYCVSDTISAATAGDVIIYQDDANLGTLVKFCPGYGMRCQIPVSSALVGVHQTSTRWLYSGVYGCSYTSRARMHDPISYSHSIYHRTTTNVEYVGGNGPYYLDESYQERCREPIFDLEDPATNAAFFADWNVYGSPQCSDVRVVTSTSSPIYCYAPTALEADSAPHACRIFRQGIRCADNYPPEFNYP